MTSILDEGEAWSSVRSYLAARTWWCFVPLDDVGDQVVEEIEDHAYVGPANADFHLLLIPGEFGRAMGAFFFGAKKHLSSEMLSELVGHAVTGRQDVIFLGGPECELRARAVASRIAEMVDGPSS